MLGQGRGAVVAPVSLGAYLVPKAAYAWGSHEQIAPAAHALLRQAGAIRIPLSGAETPRPRDRRARVWILPYGSGVRGGLRWVLSERARRIAGRGGRYREESPSMIWCTHGEGAKAGIHLALAAPLLSAEDRIVASCSAEAKLLRWMMPGFPRIESLPLVLPGNWSSPRPAEAVRHRLRRRWGFGPADRVILYAGRLSTQKNLDQLIRTFARVLVREPRARLLLAGEADDLGFPHFGRRDSTPILDRLARIVSRQRLGDVVRFVGKLPQAELRMAFGVADLQISLTTHYGEDFGYSIAQGLAQRLPTVVTRWGGGLDFVAAGAARGVSVRLGDRGPEPDRSEAVEHVIELLQDARAFDRASRAARRYAESALLPQAQLAGWRSWMSEAERAREFGVRMRPELLRFHRERKGAGLLFRGPDDPLYRRICRIYAGG